MRNIAIIFFCISLFASSCTNKQSNVNDNKKQIPGVKETTLDNIVKDTITNEEGQILYMCFNNTKGTATFILNLDTIKLNQDTMGSGIKYSNDHYEFTEWHGNGELKKDTITIFKYNNQ